MKTEPMAQTTPGKPDMVETPEPRSADYLKLNRENGGLPDDPTDSGEPVKNKVPYKNLTGGR